VGLSEEAEHASARVLELQSEDPNALNHLGTLWRERGQLEPAVEPLPHLAEEKAFNRTGREATQDNPSCAIPIAQDCWNLGHGGGAGGRGGPRGGVGGGRRGRGRAWVVGPNGILDVTARAPGP
jgi:hypothetical protein